MCNKNQLNVILRKIAEAYHKIYGKNVKKVLLYGSYARGDNTDQSDIDIVAIVNGEKKIYLITKIQKKKGQRLLHNKKIELMKYRLGMSKEQLASSKILLDAGNYKDSIGRSYYSMFTATRALLALDCVDFSKHTGVISYFQKEYIKTGLIDRKYSKYLSQAFQIRNNSDYADFFIVSKSDAEYQ